MAILRKYSILSLVLIISLVGCSTPKDNQQVSYQLNGLISINRQAPEVTSLKAPHSLAFMPVQFDSYWLKINTEANQLELMQGSRKVNSYKFINHQELPTGSYKIVLKDNNPLWYANENYYLERKLPVPVEFSEERYLKGIYGEQALFLENGTAIFSNQEDQNLALGINLEKEIINLIYQNITVDSLVVIN